MEAVRRGRCEGEVLQVVLFGRRLLRRNQKEEGDGLDLVRLE